MQRTTRSNVKDSNKLQCNSKEKNMSRLIIQFHNVTHTEQFSPVDHTGKEGNYLQ